MAEKGQGLKFSARIDLTQARKDRDELKKMLADLKIDTAKVTGPTNSAAHKATMDALKQARLERAQALADTAKLNLLEKERTIELKKQAQAAKEAQVAKRPTGISNSQNEVDAYNNVVNGAREITTTLNAQDIAQHAASVSAEQLSQETVKGTSAVKQSNVTKKQAAFLLEEEKYRQQQATKELKNNVREMNNAKGSVEQRRAALIRLQTAYDRLSASERNSASGQRLSGIIGRVHTQVLDLERTTGRTGRNVGNYLTQAWSGLKNIAMLIPGLGLAGLLGFLIEPLAKLISGMDAFASKISQAKLQQDTLNKALAGNEYAEAAKQVSELRINIDLAKKGLIDKKEVVKQYNESIGKTTGQITTLDQAERAMVKNGDAYIQMTLLKAAAQLSLEEAAKKSFEAEKARQEGGLILSDTKGASRNLNNLSIWERLQSAFTQNDAVTDSLVNNATNKRVKSAESERDKMLKIGTEFQKRAAEIAKKSGFNLFSKDDKAKGPESNPELTARNALQKRIDSLIDESNKKQLTSDQQGLESVRLKYVGMREDVEAFYKKYKKLRVDASKLDKAEKAETDAIKYKQETEQVKESLSKQKQLQADYETYRNDFGEAKALERYGREINYLKQLEAERNKITIENDRSKYLDEQIAAEKTAQQKKNNDLLKQFQTYATTRQLIEEKYQRDISGLSEDEVKVATERRDKDLTELDQANLEKWQSYKNLFDDLENMSKKQTLIAISEFEKELKAANITAEARKKAEDQIAKLKKGITKGDKDGLREAAEQLSRIASQFNDINGSIGSITSVLVNAASSYIEIMKGMDAFKTAKKDGDTLGQVTAGLGIAGAAINIATSVAKFFKAAKESRKQAAAEMQKFQDESIKGELAYNQLLRERARTLKEIGKLTIAELKTQQSILGTQSLQAQQDYTRLLNLLNASGKQITGQHTEKFGGILGIGRKTRTVEDTAGVAGLTFDELEQLFTQGKLTDSTKQWFEQLQKAKSEMEAIGISGQDVVDAINQVATGTTASSIADAIISGFRQGRRSAADFADDFKGLMTDAALSVFKSNFLNKAIDGFYKDFAAASEDGLSDRDVQTLRDAYSKIITDGAAKLADFDKVIGGVGNSPNSPNTLAGALKTASQESIDLLAGQVGGMRLAQIETNTLLKPIGKSTEDLFLLSRDNFDTMLKIEANTLRTANNTDRLSAIETAIVSIDRKTVNGGILGANGKGP